MKKPNLTCSPHWPYCMKSDQIFFIYLFFIMTVIPISLKRDFNPESIQNIISPSPKFAYHKFGILLLILLFTGMGTPLNAQVHCGTYSAPPPSTNNPDSLVYDRFGNAFDIADMVVPAQVAGATGGCDSSYFELTFESDVSAKMQSITQAVFCYLSELISQRKSLTDCQSVWPRLFRILCQVLEVNTFQ